MALGILEIIAGIWLFSIPAATLAVTFIFVIGVWIIVVTINSLCEACVMTSYTRDWGIWMICILLITLILSLLFLSGPVAGGIAVWMWLAFSLMTFGVYRIILGMKINKINRISHGII